jgi:hypothetical protein
VRAHGHHRRSLMRPASSRGGGLARSGPPAPSP